MIYPTVLELSENGGCDLPHRMLVIVYPIVLELSENGGSDLPHRMLVIATQPDRSSRNYNLL